MRNLQKILALVLALVMSLSLMATAGATDFSDDAEIDETFRESVDVLNGLKVFQGYDNGAYFSPKGDITRAEVAAIIYRIATGDVSDSQVKIYADYNKFSDVPSDHWAAGYINYCTNAEYIKGRGDGKFYPSDKVTGYEALAMILRVVGYDKNGEFTGADWQVQTAATANQRKVTKNVNAGTLGNPASRETVAELLCQAILIEKVNYTLAFGYQISTDPKDTIAYETFKMEKLTGVVTGNEIADLYADSPKPAGQTDLLVDGEELTLNVVSDLDDIGESCRVYVRPQSGTTRYDMVTADVYATEENNVYDSGDRVSDVAGKSYTDNGINSIAGAEHFINFSQGTDYEARIRIRYEMTMGWSEYEAKMVLATNDSANSSQKLTAPDGTVYESGDVSLNDADKWETRRTVNANWTYTKTIESFAKLTDQDYNFIRTIFAKGDRNNTTFVKGEVYVGTNTQIANPDDISDDIRWEDFVATYLKVEENRKQVKTNGLGNRLKVIDNNNDGVADYVLQTIFTVAKVAPNGTSLDVNGMKFADSSYNDAVNNVDGEDLVSVTGINLEKSEDSLAAGDVVVYALIDGYIRAQKAESETSRVTTINRSTTPPTATIESGEKKESAVHEHSDGLASGVTGMVIGTNYTSYFDLYGNLAAYTEGEVGKFVLITDGWFNQTAAAREYAVQAYIDGSLQNVNITNNGHLFIENNDGTNNNWRKLKALGGSNGALNNQNSSVIDNTKLRTTVACLDGGNLLPVEQSMYYRQRVAMLDMRDNAIPTNNGNARGDVYTTSTNWNSATAYDGQTGDLKDVQVLGRSDTVYYTVYKNGINNVTGQPNYIVRSYTGYGNVPSINKLYIEDVYAVGIAANATTSTNNPTYYTAEVVVIELNEKYTYQNDSEQVFIPGITVVNNDVTRAAGYGIETITMIRGNGEVQDVQVDMSQSEVRWYNFALSGSTNNKSYAGLYFMDPTDSNPNVYRIRPMSPEAIRANNYMAGYVTKSQAIVPTDYVVVDMMLNDGNENNGPIAADRNTHNIDVTLNKSVTANSKLYTLGYSGNVANLKEAAAGVVFEQDPDRNRTDLEKSTLNELWVQGTDSFNQNPRNEVLVRYSGNSIVWAISFREFNGNNRDFAQTVWYKNLPSTTASSNVKFWGYEVPANGITISHSQAALNAGTNSVIDLTEFKGGTVRSYTLSKLSADGRTWTTINENNEVLTPERAEYRLTINMNNGTSFEYILIKDAATSGADMKLKKNALPGAVLNTVAPELGTLPAAMELDSYIAQYEISSGATATWTFVTNGGKQIVFQGKNLTAGDAKPEYTCTSSNYETQTTTDINYVTVTVVAEQGNATNTYRSANVPAVTVQPSAGVTVNGVGGNQTVYFGQVLSVKAPSTGKLVINGTSYDVNSANNFTVEYTVPADATTVVITFTADTTTPSADGKLTLGTTVAGVKVVSDGTGSVGYVAGQDLGNTNGATTVYVKFDGAAAGTYMLQMSNTTGKVLTAGTLVLTSAEAAANPVKSANVTIPDGEWTLTIVKKGSAQTLTLDTQQSAGADVNNINFPEVTVKVNGTKVNKGTTITIDAFDSATVAVETPAGYVVGLVASSGFVVAQKGAANEWTVTNDNATVSGQLTVYVSADANYKLVRVDQAADANAIFYKDSTKAVIMERGATYALPLNGEIIVSAKPGYTVGDVGLNNGTSYAWNNTNGAVNTDDGDVKVATNATTKVVTATVGATRWYAYVAPNSHGANYYIAKGYVSGNNQNVRWLSESELKTAVEGGEFAFIIKGNSGATVKNTLVEVLNVKTTGDSTTIWAKASAGLVKVHTCPNPVAGYENSCAGQGSVQGTTSGATFTLDHRNHEDIYKWFDTDVTMNTDKWNNN